jgi:hypothetical protein
MGNIDIKSMQDIRASAAAGTVKYSMSSDTFVLEAAMSLTLKAGASSINIGPAGILITGTPMVLINTGGGSASAAQQAKVQAVPGKLADRKMKGAEGALVGNMSKQSKPNGVEPWVMNLYREEFANQSHADQL